jgi:16S rRNA (guanine966-N2)-methyltransferase
MRIIGGSSKGRKLHSVPGRSTRPSGGRLREAVFAITAGAVPGARVLDLFAGTGAFGLEALSRGASYAVFIDFDPRAVSTIKRNLRLMRAEKRGKCMQYDVARDLNCIRGILPPFDLAFLDPPYGEDLIRKGLQNLAECGCLADEALVIIEHGAKSPFPEALPPAFVETDRRRYGKSLVTFLQHVLIGSFSGAGAGRQELNLP